MRLTRRQFVAGGAGALAAAGVYGLVDHLTEAPARGPARVLPSEQHALGRLEIVMDNRKESAGLYAQLAVLAAGANQTRKSELAEQKAIDLAPKAQRKQLKSDIDLAKSQVNVQQPGASQSG